MHTKLKFNSRGRAMQKGKQTRKVGECKSCHERRELAAHELCYRCLRRQDRALERSDALSDPLSPAARRERRKLLRVFDGLMGALVEAGVGPAVIMDVREKVRPNFELVAPLIGYPVDSDGEESVTSEHNDAKAVHKGSKAKRKKEEEEETDEGGQEDEGEDSQED